MAVSEPRSWHPESASVPTPDSDLWPLWDSDASASLSFAGLGAPALSALERAGSRGGAAGDSLSVRKDQSWGVRWQLQAGCITLAL